MRKDNFLRVKTTSKINSFLSMVLSIKITKFSSPIIDICQWDSYLKGVSLPHMKMGKNSTVMWI